MVQQQLNHNLPEGCPLQCGVAGVLAALAGAVIGPSARRANITLYVTFKQLKPSVKNSEQSPL